MSGVRAIPPMIDIRNATFAEEYEHGLRWYFEEEMKDEGPVKDVHLLTALKAWAKQGAFDPQKEEHLRVCVSLSLGMIHGGVLSPTTGQLRSDGTTLVTFTNQDAARGYRVGREYFFHEVGEPQERRFTDESLLERLREDVFEMAGHKVDDATWYYILGCILGGLSGHLFPETDRERQAREEVQHAFESTLKQGQEGDDSKAFPLVKLQEVS